MGSLRATHRGFVLVSEGYPQACRYEFRPQDGPEVHDLDPVRLQSQLYLGKRVKPPRWRRG